MATASAVWRFWGWSGAALWGGGALVALLLAWVADGQRTPGGLVAAAANGALLFFLVGGLGVIDNAAAAAAAGDVGALHLGARPWALAAVPAAATLVTLLPVRLLALALHVDGPWSGVAESALDVAVRAAVVFGIVGVVAQISRPA